MYKALVFAASILVATSSLPAGHVVAEAPTQESLVVSSDFPFIKGTREFELGIGALWAVGTEGSPERPDVAFVQANARLGFMLSDVHGDGIFRGNFELLVGAFGGLILEGPGEGLVGTELLLRYNFVQPGAGIVPFFQVGGGGLYNDAASADGTQRLFGSDFLFNLQASLGLRWMMSERVGMSLAAEFRHFSNADTADRNRGVNALGGIFSVNWFF